MNPINPLVNIAQDAHIVLDVNFRNLDAVGMPILGVLVGIAIGVAISPLIFKFLKNW